MSTTVTIQGNTYTLNQQGDNPPYGDQLSALLQALVNVSNSITGSSDISPSSFLLLNNQASAANISGLIFSISTVRSAVIDYNIYRTTNTTEVCESGVIVICYSSVAGSWSKSHLCTGNANTRLSITTSGQFQYVTDNMSGTGYAGKISFRARSLNQ